jgi:putative acetyltransferase
MHIRAAQPSDEPLLLALWERSVRTTHTFLDEADITFYRPLTASYLASGTAELWVLVDEADMPVGFMGLAAQGIDALFLDPAFRGRGGGRMLVAHAQALAGGALTVDVNEENAAASAFYEALGFVVVERSPLDDWGRPRPVLHMRRAAPRDEGGGRAAPASARR